MVLFFDQKVVTDIYGFSPHAIHPHSFCFQPAMDQLLLLF